MKVRAVINFRTRSGEVPAGYVFDVDPTLLPKLAGMVEPLDLHRLVGEALTEVDRLGRPWPARFLADLPAEDRRRLRETQKAIDRAVQTDNIEEIHDLLDEWRALLLRRLN